MCSIKEHAKAAKEVPVFERNRSFWPKKKVRFKRNKQQEQQLSTFRLNPPKGEEKKTHIYIRTYVHTYVLPRRFHAECSEARFASHVSLSTIRESFSTLKN